MDGRDGDNGGANARSRKEACEADAGESTQERRGGRRRHEGSGWVYERTLRRGGWGRYARGSMETGEDGSGGMGVVGEVEVDV